MKSILGIAEVEAQILATKEQLAEPPTSAEVSSAAIITDDGRLAGKSRWYGRAKFDRKIVVVCERRTLQIVALVELDDPSESGG